MTTNIDNQYIIMKHRFECLMVSTAKANDLAGRELPGYVKYEDSEQGFARRELLQVEKQAIENKQIDEITNQSYVDSVRNEFHRTLLKHLETELQDYTSIYHRTLNLNDALPDLLDLLAVKACTIARLEPLAARVPWLFEELLKVVNAPQNRRRDSRGRIIVVETLRAALSFINIDNLQLLIPALIFRRTIPQITDPFPQIKARAWQQALNTGLTARFLAPAAGVRANDAYVLGILQGIGRNAITRLYFRLFERLQRHELEVAQAKKQRKQHDALTQIEPSSNFLIALWNDYADKTLAETLEYMHLKRLFIHPSAKTLANGPTPGEQDPLAILVEKARTYAQFRMLKTQRLIEPDEAKVVLRTSKIPASEIAQLNKLDLSKLPLNLKPDLDEYE
ncbi:HDOD domain-containing protein [Alteromonas sp. ASW11-36]|uniref:HDOD domain-containing protein n=1 Tax=Alteromonas arenosi TaxID=3055817 RepID=A0ABT7SYH9_9ALTE|nr:HDOD domain-containing protein [Alteromonas sp. ASW11-36]MDM7861250.1 HDOD domain-containing protein [Alteromonas sp. ASW11-36]